MLFVFSFLIRKRSIQYPTRKNQAAMSKGIELMNSVISFSPNRENTASTTPSAMKAGKAVYIRICVGHPGSIHKVSGSHDTQSELGGSQGSGI
jgi:hypothetical protein